MKAGLLIVGVIAVAAAIANALGLMGALSYDILRIGFAGGGGVLLIISAFKG